MNNNINDIKCKILFHTIGNGAFRCLSENGIFDDRAWTDFTNALSELGKKWKNVSLVECELVGALFDLSRLLDDIENKSTEEIQKKINDLVPRMDLSALFYGTHGECPQRTYDIPVFENGELNMSEDEAIQCILFHTEGGGAFRQARTFRNYKEKMWNQLIYAIKKLKVYRCGRKMIEREVAAAFLSFPLHVRYQADYFYESNSKSVEYIKLSELVKILAREISELLISY